MNERVEAVFENGVFLPQGPVSVRNGQRVALSIEPITAADDALGDVNDLLDVGFMESCRREAQARTKPAPPLEEVQMLTSAFQGTLADLISAERDER